MERRRSWRLAAAALLALGGSALGQTAGPAPLAGTSWQLVRFQEGDDTIVTPDDGSRYTLTFARDGTVTTRIFCNRGRGTWTSSGPNRLEFGPLVLTRAFCGPPSMHDRIVKHWSAIRSYVLRDGRLFLSLFADGGIYEFQPAAAAPGPFKTPVTVRGTVTFSCGGTETLRATFYQTQPAMVLLERGGVTRVAFQVTAASGARYEGDGVLFWEARRQATLNWMGVESVCKPA
jgi:heat shock protein HslJ/membrane-bound inhibitor of C-type lysozyme